jgi:hypothetical protein
MINLKSIVFYSIFLTIVLDMVIRIYILTEMNNVPEICFDEIKFKTGDIICFRWSYIDNDFRLFSKFSHVGIVIVPNKIGNQNPLILEIHPNEEDSYGKVVRDHGVHIYKLKHRLKMYYGSYYHASLKSKFYNSNLTKKILKNIKKYSKIIFDNNFRIEFLKNYIMNLFGIPLTPNNWHLFCSQFVGYIQKDIGISDNARTSHILMNPEAPSQIKSKENEMIYNDLVRII